MLKRILNWAGWIIAFIFLALAAWRLNNTADWQTVIASADYVDLFFAFVLLFIGLFFRSLSGYVSFRSTDNYLSISESWRIWFVSQLSKYIPGGIWQFATRGVLYSRAGISLSSGGLITLWETVAILLSGISIFLILGIFQSLENSLLWFVGFMVLVVLIVLTTNQRFLNFIANFQIPFLRQHLDKLTLNDAATQKMFLRLLLLSFVGWIFISLSFHYTVLAFVPDMANGIVGSTFAYSLAWVIGFLVIIAPGGLGAREAVIIAYYTALTGESIAISIALMARLIWFLAEGLHILGATLLIRRIISEPSYDFAHNPEGDTP